MSDEPTVGEQLRRLGDQMDRIERQMSGLVSTEKFDFTQREAARESAILAERIGKIEAAAEKSRDDQIQTRRMVWTSLLIPLGLLLLQMYLSSWSK